MCFGPKKNLLSPRLELTTQGMMGIPMISAKCDTTQPGVPGRSFIKYGPNPASFSNSNAIFTTKKCEKITIWYPVQRFKPMTSRK